MKTLYLHIGMPKTGTSYLQSFLRKNNEALNAAGYIYPEFGHKFEGIGVARNGYFLINTEHSESGERLYDSEKQIEDECFGKLLEFFAEYDNVILSDEGIWNSAERNRGGGFWHSLADRLNEQGIELKVIAYLRRQDSFIQSYWAQRVKTCTGDTPLTVAEFMKDERFSYIKLNYYKRLERIAAVTGRGNIIVRPYEKSQYLGSKSSISSDFLNAVGLEYDESFLEPERTVNPSLTGIYLDLIIELSKTANFKSDGIFPRLLMIEVAEKRGELQSKATDSYITYGQARKIIKKYNVGNRKVARDYLGREDMTLFLEVPEKGSYNMTEYSQAEYFEVIADLLTTQHDKAVKYSAEINRLKDIIDELRLENKQLTKDCNRLNSTVEWMSASLPKKVIRKLKRTFGKTG